VTPTLRIGEDDVNFGHEATVSKVGDDQLCMATSERGHRAGGLADDLVDQLESMLGVLAEPDQRDVGSLPRGNGSDVLDIDLARDHLVAEGDDERADERESGLSLIGDQDTEMVGAIRERIHDPILSLARLAQPLVPVGYPEYYE